MEPVHVNPEEAVRIHRDVGARVSIGMHFGTFRLTDEGIDDPLRALAAARSGGGPARRRVQDAGFRGERGRSAADVDSLP